MKNHPTYPYHCAWVAPRISWWMLIVLLSLTSTVVSHAQVDVFMRISEGSFANALPGNSDDPVYKSTEGWFRIRSFKLGAERVLEGTPGGDVKIRELGAIALDIGKEVSVISPSIYIAMARGSFFERMEIVVRKQGTRTGEAYLRYEFLLTLPTRQNWVGGEDEPSETISLTYEAFRMTVRPQSSTGELGAPVVAAWDFTHNKEGFAVK